MPPPGGGPPKPPPGGGAPKPPPGGGAPPLIIVGSGPPPGGGAPKPPPGGGPPGGAPYIGFGGGAPAAGGGAPKPGGGWKFASVATIVPASAFTLPPPPKPASGGGAPIGGGGVGSAAGGIGACGIFAEPGIGGATPTIVPFNLLGGGPAGRGGIAGAPAAGGAPGGGAPGTGPGVPPTPGGRPPACCDDISIVPLNFGAAAPFKLKLHFVHVWAVSGFCVPQFGQNTEPPLVGFEKPRGSIQAEISLTQGERLP